MKKCTFYLPANYWPTTDLLLTYYWPTTNLLPTYYQPTLTTTYCKQTWEFKSIPSTYLIIGAWHSCTVGLVSLIKHHVLSASSFLGHHVLSASHLIVIMSSLSSSPLIDQNFLSLVIISCNWSSCPLIGLCVISIHFPPFTTISNYFDSRCPVNWWYFHQLEISSVLSETIRENFH